MLTPDIPVFDLSQSVASAQQTAVLLDAYLAIGPAQVVAILWSWQGDHVVGMTTTN
jgi:hypothetical protein